eukprot:jgi/Botrbrau1/13194/Bobra.0351s0007.1
MSKYMDTLGELSEDSEESELEAPERPTLKKRKPAQAAVPDPDTLQEMGFQTPSVLLIPEKPDVVEPNWEWNKGSRSQAGETETLEEREETRRAATTGVLESAEIANKAQARAALLKQEAYEERQRIAQEKRLTFQQKEKRKREVGQAKSAKNYVEEEKRIARNFGVYSGFD